MGESFPDLSSKLGAPTKKSLFERQKAEAEAKKAREKAETAAALEDFVKSFDDDGRAEGANHNIPNRPGGGHSSATFSAGPGKRHFTSTGLKSGPGSLGPILDTPKTGPGSLGPVPSNHGRKRPYEAFQGQRRDRSYGTLAYDDERLSPMRRDPEDLTSAFDQDDQKLDYKETKAAAKPTLHLSSLPPGTSPAVIRALFTPSPLTIDEVHILPPPAPSANGERKSTSAIVTLASETPATDIESMVSHLQSQYLGFGFKLSISRHLSSAALGVSAVSIPGVSTSLPFGAKQLQQHMSLSRAPPPGRFAPPTSYTSSTPYTQRSNMPPTQIAVQSPTELSQLKLIHKTLEALLTYGPEFEALLMSRPEVQREEKWAWLWDSRSIGGVYYRWRLWDVLTNGSARRKKQRGGYALSAMGETLFEGQSVWVSPEPGLKFEYTTQIEEFVSDDDYDSSDEEADNDGGIARRYNDHKSAGSALEETNEGTGYLNPLAKTKLVHLLSRLPESNTKLRKGDIARITSFAIEHAGTGADEVVELIVRNVTDPLSYSLPRDRDDEENKDHSSASLVGLYVISDILSSSASAGVRHAWRYRSIFENVLRQRKVFETLGRLERGLGWGKLKAEKWKRSVQSILSLWEGWCVFPQTSHEGFVERFMNPPLTEKENQAAKADERRRAEEETKRAKSSSKWRSVDEDLATGDKGDVEMNDVDGAVMTDEEEEEAMDDDSGSIGDIDGLPMIDSSDEETEEDEVEAQTPDIEALENPPSAPPSTTSLTRKPRLKAVDMFADDSDGE